MSATMPVLSQWHRLPRSRVRRPMRGATSIRDVLVCIHMRESVLEGLTWWCRRTTMSAYMELVFLAKADQIMNKQRDTDPGQVER